MKTEVLSAFDAISRPHFLPGTIIIRITNRKYHQDLKGKVKDELRLYFDDIQDRDIKDKEKGISKKKFFTEDMVSEVVKFLEKNSDAEHLICQCEAGISRSAGMALGLNESYFQDKPEVRKLRKLEGKRPNRHVRYMLSKLKERK